MWIYLLKTKDEAFKTFKQWKVMVENQCSNRIENVRTDNGLEYLADVFTEFCKDKGIIRHKTVRKTPQQNGLAERMNKTLLEHVRCLLSNAKLPLKFWREAVHTVCYLINRAPYAAIQFKTPQELWSGQPADYSNLRVFGCIAYYHVNEGKLASRAKKGLFMGYPDGVKGFKIWCLESRKCIISRDVTFHEEGTLNPQEKLQFQGDLQAETGRLELEVEPLDGRIEETERFARVDEPNDDVQVQDVEQQQVQTYRLARDRNKREAKPPERYGYVDLIAYALTVVEDFIDEEPKTFQEAVNAIDSDKWLCAMNEELESLKKNNT